MSKKSEEPSSIALKRLFNSKTIDLIENHVSSYSQTLLITGSPVALSGSWSHYFANKYRARVFGEESVVSIDEVREIRRSASKVNAGFFVIVNFDLARKEAQNSLLKIIEEPNSGTHVILVADSSKLIVDTIMSRVVNIEASFVDRSELINLFGQELDCSSSLLTKISNITGVDDRLFVNVSSSGFDENDVSELISAAKLIVSRGSKSEIAAGIHKASSSKDKIQVLLVILSSLEKHLYYNQKHHLFNSGVIEKATKQARSNVNSKAILQNVLYSY